MSESDGDDLDVATKIPYRDYRSGMKLPSGAVVRKVFGAGKDFAIYSTDKSLSPVWVTSCSDSGVSEGLHKLKMLQVRASNRFKSVWKVELNDYIVHVLKCIFFDRDEERTCLALDALEEAIDSIPRVEHLIARGKNFSVWITEGGGCGYQFRDIPDMDESTAEFTRIRALASALLPEEYKKKFNRKLGAVMANALRFPPGSKAPENFKPLEDMIHRAAENKLKAQLLVSTIAAATIMVCLLYIGLVLDVVPGVINVAAPAIFGGMIGTLLSILERSNSITISEYESPSLIIMQGLVRLMIGGLLSYIAYCATVSGFAFSVFQDSKEAIFILGVAAGFSERLIPELIQDVAGSKEKS